MQQQPSFSELEEYLAGELDAERARSIEAAAENDPELASWLETRKKEQREFLFDPRRKSFAALVAAAQVKERPRPWRWLIPLSATASVAAVLLVFMATIDPRPVLRQKGSLSVRAAVLDGQASTILLGNRRLHPGDRLRLTVDDPQGGYLTVLLQEAGGKVDVLYAPAELGRLAPGSHLLPDSLELDRALGRERLYVIMSEGTPDVDTWTDEIEASHKKAGFDHGWLPSGNTRVTTIEYEKESGP
jgi:hypothetical protein